jgi:hypothetical protein
MLLLRPPLRRLVRKRKGVAGVGGLRIIRAMATSDAGACDRCSTQLPTPEFKHVEREWRIGTQRQALRVLICRKCLKELGSEDVLVAWMMRKYQTV